MIEEKHWYLDEEYCISNILKEATKMNYMIERKDAIEIRTQVFNLQTQEADDCFQQRDKIVSNIFYQKAYIEELKEGSQANEGALAKSKTDRKIREVKTFTQINCEEDSEEDQA